MASFAEFIAESFHSEVDLIWNVTAVDRVTASFEVDRSSVVVSFERKHDSPAWHVVFEVTGGEATAVAYSSFKIFNGVMHAVTEFAEVRQPDMLVFASKNEGLTSIYQTYLRRESATLQELGYVLEGPQRVDPFVEFTLRKVKPPQWKS